MNWMSGSRTIGPARCHPLDRRKLLRSPASGRTQQPWMTRFNDGALRLRPPRDRNHLRGASGLSPKRLRRLKHFERLCICFSQALDALNLNRDLLSPIPKAGSSLNDLSRRISNGLLDGPVLRDWKYNLKESLS